MIGRLRVLGVLVFALAMASARAAQQEVEQKDIRYVPMQPTVVTNYGYEPRGRLRYLKADISLRVDGQDDEVAVRTHMPSLRAEVLLLIAAQSDEVLRTSEGREQLRGDMLANFRDFLQREEGRPVIEEVLFVNFIVQR